uniref:Homologous to N terminal region of thuA gene of Sinorhizobium meliloti n=1 Tax=Agrobacterium tumefaciens TaxID=358 RepID=Q8L121_AGRTU|nr:unnamed protein product [Agrobacterium tumefaciens]
MTINTVVWGENIHEHINETVRSIYPDGMHNTIADALNTNPEISATTATLQEPEHGLSQERLDKTTFWSGGATRTTVRFRMKSSSALPSVSGKAWASSSCIPATSPSLSSD